MPKKAIATILGGLALGAAPIVPVDTKCFSSYSQPIYDTPSGDLELGYYDISYDHLPSATTTPVRAARVIGQQYTAKCKDETGRIFEMKLSEAEYKSQERSILSKRASKSVGAVFIDAI